MNKRAIFGAGAVFLKGTDGVSHRVAIISEASVEVSMSQVELYGENMFPEDVANGKASVKGTLKFAHVDPRLVAAILSGSLTSGSQRVVTDTGSIPANPGPYTVTVLGSANFAEDLGVYIAGAPATVVAANPAVGEYSVNTGTGVYTFAAADQGKAYEISYRESSTGGQTVALDNKAMGESPEFALLVYNKYRSNRLGLKFPAVALGKWALAFGNEAHATQDSDFTAFASSSGRVAEIWVG
jgi:hypothetical protein